MFFYLALSLLFVHEIESVSKHIWRHYAVLVHFSIIIEPKVAVKVNIASLYMHQHIANANTHMLNFRIV